MTYRKDSEIQLKNSSQSAARPLRWALLKSNQIFQFLPRRLRQRSTQIAIDSFMAAVAVWLAYECRFDFDIPQELAPGMWLWIVAMAVLHPALLMAFTGYRAIWRYLRIQDLTRLLLAALPASLLFWIFSTYPSSSMAHVPRGIVALEYGMFAGLAAGVRALRRVIYEQASRTPAQRQQALLLGTEETLAGALAQVRAFGSLETVGLIAPGKHLRGFHIGGVAVVAEPHELRSLFYKIHVDLILISDTTLDWIAEAKSIASQFGIEAHLVPSLANIMRREVRIAAPVNPELALEKTAVSAPHAPAVLAAYKDRVVLITGAGGSIGSELTRQICGLEVCRLVLLDNDENSIFEIHNELKAASAAEIVPCVGDLRDQHLLNHLFLKHRPEIVLHAAAYKHVPVMETNVSEAVLNNVVGTKRLLDAAISFGSERFLMISSDKAVRPSSVMGATKRIAEMLVESRAASTERTRVGCVRFGNVVGSRGSVIPIFLKQIAEGRAVTVTDERMSRYFMTIKEAVRLVLQASTLANRGEIYVLDMGNPVPIKTLARKLIAMSGLLPEKDVPIQVVGIRPGEKIEESLWHVNARAVQTRFSGVYRIEAASVLENFELSIAELEANALERRDSELVSKLRQMPIGYRTDPFSAKSQPLIRLSAESQH